MAFTVIINTVGKVTLIRPTTRHVTDTPHYKFSLFVSFHKSMIVWRAHVIRSHCATGYAVA